MKLNMIESYLISTITVNSSEEHYKPRALDFVINGITLIRFTAAQH